MYLQILNCRKSLTTAHRALPERLKPLKIISLASRACNLGMPSGQWFQKLPWRAVFIVHDPLRGSFTCVELLRSSTICALRAHYFYTSLTQQATIVSDMCCRPRPTRNGFILRMAISVGHGHSTYLSASFSCSARSELCVLSQEKTTFFLEKVLNSWSDLAEKENSSSACGGWSVWKSSKLLRNPAGSLTI